MNTDPRQARPATGPNKSAEAQKAALYLKTWYAGFANEYRFNNRWNNTTAVYFSNTNFRNPTIRNYERKTEQGLGARSVTNCWFQRAPGRAPHRPDPAVDPDDAIRSELRMDHHWLRHDSGGRARPGQRTGSLAAVVGGRHATVGRVRHFGSSHMTRSLRYASALVLALSLGLLAACGGGQSSSSVAVGGAAQGLKIAVIAKSSTNPVFLSARTGAEAAAKELTAKTNVPIEIVWMTPPSEDGQVQAQRIAQAVNEGASAILISCSDAGKVNGAINDAVARGVEVMTFDSDAPESKRFAFYGVDDIETGETVMDELAKQMGEKGAVAILAGNQNAPNLRKRVDGVKQAAAKYPKMKIVDTFYHIETPQDAAAEVLRVQGAYPEVQGWAMIGGWPLFTQTLLTDLDPKRVKIVAVDGLPAELPTSRRAWRRCCSRSRLQVGLRRRADHLRRRSREEERPAILPMELVRVSKDNLGTWHAS